MLNVCLCFTDASGDYYRHPLVALTSVFENTTARIRAYVLCDESVTDAAKNAFIALAERYGQEVIIGAVPPISQSVLESTRAIFGKGTLYRLFLPELVQEKTLLYLDCDVVCTMDVAEIFSTDMSALPAAGVADTGMLYDAQSVRRLRGMGLEPARYVNAGVMLYNLDILRNDYPDYADTVFASIAEKKFYYPDQDALNIYFQGKGLNIAVLPEAYNYMIGPKDRAWLDPPEYAGKILHYTFGDKPWDALFPAALQYWKYYAVAFSCVDAFAGMDKLGKREHAHLFNFLLRKPKIRRMVNRISQIAEQGFWETVLDRLLPGRKKQKRQQKAAKGTTIS